MSTKSKDLPEGVTDLSQSARSWVSVHPGRPGTTPDPPS